MSDLQYPEVRGCYVRGGAYERISDKEKESFYSKLFPICHDGNAGTIHEIETLADKMRKSKNTNLEVLLDYCIEQAKANKIK